MTTGLSGYTGFLPDAQVDSLPPPYTHTHTLTPDKASTQWEPPAYLSPGPTHLNVEVGWYFSLTVDCWGEDVPQRLVWTLFGATAEPSWAGWLSSSKMVISLPSSTSCPLGKELSVSEVASIFAL